MLFASAISDSGEQVQRYAERTVETVIRMTSPDIQTPFPGRRASVNRT